MSLRVEGSSFVHILFLGGSEVSFSHWEEGKCLRRGTRAAGGLQKVNLAEESTR